MPDETAMTARLMKVAEAAVEEFDRQGVAEALANLNFDPHGAGESGHQGRGRRCDPIPGQSPRSLRFSA
jgi:hypothetical protein